MNDSENKNVALDEQLRGAICASFIDPQIKAVSELNFLLERFIGEGIDLLMCYEHNGTLLAKQLQAHEQIPEKCVTFPCPPLKVCYDEQGEEVPVLKDYFPDQIILYSGLRDLQFTSAIDGYVQPHADRKFTIVLVENFCTGKTMRALSLLIKDALDKYPMLYLKTLLLQETIQKNEITIPDKHLIEYAKLQEHVASERCSIHYRQVPYILGKDVDFQSMHGHPESGRPVIVFGTVNGELVTMKLTPDGNSTARDIVIGLARGNFKDKLGNLH